MVRAWGRAPVLGQNILLFQVTTAQKGGDAARDSPATRQGIAPDLMEILMLLAVGLGLPGLLPFPFSGIATAREASHAGGIARDVFCSALRLLSIATVVSGSVSRTVAEASYILNILRVKCLINHHIWSLLSLSTVMSILTYSCSTEEVAGFNSLLLVCQLLKWSKCYSQCRLKKKGNAAHLGEILVVPANERG